MQSETPTKSRIERFWSRVSKTDRCWLWTAGRGNGRYGQFYNGIKDVRAHRFAFEITHGPIPEGMHVLHRCDNPLCVNPDHLFLGTHADNMRDMAEKGRAGTRLGSANHSSKLTPEAVVEIRRLCAEGMRQRDVASRFGVCQRTVQVIAKGTAWRHVS